LKIKIRGVIVSNDDKLIYDWFEMEAVSPKDIETQLEAAAGEEVEIEINSPGGDVFAGSDIYTMLKQYPGNVVVKIVGIAASAASVIAMAGNKVLISPTAQIMIHNVWSVAMGDYRTMDHEADILKGWNKSIANAYMLKTGMAQSELLSLMNKETWITAQDAVKNKFADEVMFDEDLKLAAGIRGAPLPPEVINKIRNLIKQNPEGPRPPEQAAFLLHETGVIRQAPVEIYQAQILINRRKAHV
jgi:ATP-dependent protease ClpP protease subunit